MRSVQELYDYILIDSPPGLGILTINAFAASDGMLLPLLLLRFLRPGNGGHELAVHQILIKFFKSTVRKSASLPQMQAMQQDIIGSAAGEFHFHSAEEDIGGDDVSHFCVLNGEPSRELPSQHVVDGGGRFHRAGAPHLQSKAAGSRRVYDPV